ncbi:MAG: hypothetical protein C0593_13800 [Marinilabiliales bacterium]|nr:MAG: hypothetical protein C0593_13800 [Marinilabiliales bacterium]
MIVVWLILGLGYRDELAPLMRCLATGLFVSGLFVGTQWTLREAKGHGGCCVAKHLPKKYKGEVIQLTAIPNGT